NEVRGGCHAELRIAVDRPGDMHAAPALIVITGVGEVKSISDLNQTWIFNTPAGFVWSFCCHDRLGTSCEMNAVFTRRVAERRLPVMVLGAIQHYEFVIELNHAGIKCARGFKAIPLRGDDWLIRDSVPSAEGHSDLCGRCQDDHQERAANNATPSTSEIISH